MKRLPLMPTHRLVLFVAWFVGGLFSLALGVLVAFPEHGAGLRSSLGAPLPGLHERIGGTRWWFAPVEKKAFARRLTTMEHLIDLEVMDDGRTILVVGSSGTLLESVNAGATWKSLANNVKWRDGMPLDGSSSESAPSRPALLSVAASPDGRLAIAVGERGTVLTSGNNSAAWTERASGSEARLNSVAYDASTGRAIVVGWTGTVLTSGDNGATWTERASGSEAHLFSVAFDASTGRAIAVGSEGTVLTSDDSGATWTERASGSEAHLFSAAFDARTGRAIAVGSRGTVLISDDSGATWTERASGSSIRLRSVAFDASTGRAVVIGDPTDPFNLAATLLISEDNGTTWNAPSPVASVMLFSVAFATRTGRVIAVGLQGTVLTSDDNGATWTLRGSGSSGGLSSVAFDARTERAIAVGRDGNVLTSENNGETWTERASGSSAHLFSVAFDASTERAIAVGTDGTVLTSEDSGATWTERASPATEQLNAVAFDARTGRVIAIGGGPTMLSNDGEVLESSAILLTSDDNGVTWNRRTGTSAHLRSVAFDASTGRAIAVGVQGTVLTSEDNGSTWTERASSAKEVLNAVAFDARTGRAIAVGVQGTVFTSEDNGSTWTERPSPATEELNAVTLNTRTGRAIAVGGDATVLFSEDYGVTWTERPSGSRVLLRSVAFDGSNGRAIAVGVQGTVLISRDSGTTWSPVVLEGTLYPAPLSVVGLFLSLGGLTFFLFHHTPPTSRPERIIDLFVSDRPLGPGEPDRLAFDSYVQGLSGLLRNPGTGFPITVAATAQWGAGKSSFMRLLETDLRSNRYLPAWFNAWHDQNEENVLSSLLLAIRSQAVPRIFSRKSFRAIGLRVSLLRSRGMVFVVAALVPFFLVGAAASSAWHEWGGRPNWTEDLLPAIRATIGTYEPVYLADGTPKAICGKLHEDGVLSAKQLDVCTAHLGSLQGSEKSRTVWSSPDSLLAAMTPHPDLPFFESTVEVQRVLLSKVEHVATPTLRTLFGKLWPEFMGALWQWLTAFVAAVLFAANGASAFGFNLRRGRVGFRGTAASSSADPAGRHEQLRRDFENVSRSIGRQLVIFIDDLDRCQPAKVVETLEAVNFLVTAGECAVVLGMDYQRVAHCVGLARKELAEAEHGAATGEEAEADPRMAYAHRYLKKLINVQVPIDPDPERVKELLAKSEQPSGNAAASDRFWRLAWSMLWRSRIPAILTAVFLGVLFVVPYVHDMLMPDMAFRVVATISAPVSAPASPDPQPRPEVADDEQRPSPRPIVEPAPVSRAVPDTVPEVVYWPVIVGLLLVLLLGLLLATRRLIQGGWLKLRGAIDAPIRRFLARPEEVRDTEAFKLALDIWIDVVVHHEPTPRALKRFLNRVRFLAAMLQAENGENLGWKREINLVALAALHHVGVDYQQPKLLRPDGLHLAPHPPRTLEEAKRLSEAARKHTSPGSWSLPSAGPFESPWPPDEEEIEQFRKLSAGIHV